MREFKQSTDGMVDLIQSFTPTEIDRFYDAIFRIVTGDTGEKLHAALTLDFLMDEADRRVDGERRDKAKNTFLRQRIEKHYGMPA